MQHRNVLREPFNATVLTLRDRGLLIQFKKSCAPTTIDPLQDRPIEFKTLLGPEPFGILTVHMYEFEHRFYCRYNGSVVQEHRVSFPLPISSCGYENFRLPVTYGARKKEQQRGAGTTLPKMASE